MSRCCDAQESDIETPDGIAPCCKPCSCTSCLPYDDGVLILSQILSVLAFLHSWIWLPTFVLGIAGVLMFQLPFCMRFSRANLAVASFLAMLISLATLVHGMLKLEEECYHNTFSDYDDYYDDYYENVFDFFSDNCNDKEFFVIFACAVLWAAASFFMGVFVSSGRHEKWEKHYRNKNGISDEDENNDRNDNAVTRNPSGNSNSSTNRSANRSTNRNSGRTRNRAPTLADLERAVDELERRTASLSPEITANELLLLYNIKNDDDQ